MVDQTAALIEQLSSLGERLSSGGGGDQDVRNQALVLSRKITASLELPQNVAVDLAFSVGPIFMFLAGPYTLPLVCAAHADPEKPFLAMAARVADGLDLFKHTANSHGPITSKELASLSGGEELLITRVLRPLATIGFIHEVDEQKWEATPITKSMATEEIASGHRMVGEMIVGAAQKAPNYFREAGYRCPIEPRDGLMQYAFQTKMTSFELFKSIPRVFKDFNTFMGNTMGAREYWVDWFPVQERLLEAAKEASALIVDVGAGKGHDMIAFHAKYPGQGRLVLQDLPSVTSSLNDIDSAVEVMPYDFFTEQPVKGARSYFYHHILHDWSESYCFKILEQVKSAMTPGYSKLLIHDLIVPEKGADKFTAVFDLVMMAFNAGMERTETQWREILEKAGFEVVRVWPPPEAGADGIVEAMLKE